MTIAAEAWRLAFGSLSVEEGLAMREACETRHLPARDPGRFRDLVSIADIDAFLATNLAEVPRVAMADSSREGSAAVPDGEYTFTDGKIDPSRLFALFDGGATLVLSQFHEAHIGLARFCRGLERVYLHGVQANLYLTPPGAQGFRVHFDEHDVLVLQVSGEKRWRVWDEQPIPHATRNTPWDNALGKPDDGKAKTILMRAGDVLYVPRGVLHDAAVQEGDEPSLHVTVGLLEPSWADVLKQMIDQTELADPRVRKPFPVWRLSEEGAREAILAQARALLAEVASEATVDLASMRFLNDLTTDRMPMSGRGLFLPKIGPRDVLAVADTLHHYVVPLETGGELRWAGGAEPLSEEELGWLAALGDGASASDLGGGDEALDFCRKLFALGILVRIDTDGARVAAE